MATFWRGEAPRTAAPVRRQKCRALKARRRDPGEGPQRGKRGTRRWGCGCKMWPRRCPKGRPWQSTMAVAQMLVRTTPFTTSPRPTMNRSRTRGTLANRLQLGPRQTRTPMTIPRPRSLRRRQRTRIRAKKKRPHMRAIPAPLPLRVTVLWRWTDWRWPQPRKA